MENTKKIGNLTELRCATRLYELGCAVSLPFGNSERYDLIIDWDNKLYKVQVKHAQPLSENGEVYAIKFKTVWIGHNNNGYTTHKYTSEDANYFATFYKGECYLVPQNECSNEKTLRIIPPKNGQRKGISFLDDYKAEEVLRKL